MSIVWQKSYWNKLAKLGKLRSVIDPNDLEGIKNYQLNSIHQKNLLHFFQKNKFNQFNSILDFGCGVGRNYKFLQSISKSYFGIDISDEMLKKHEGKVVLYDGKDLPFPENHFDLIFCFWVLQHIIDDKDLIKTISEFYRCLANDGIVIICERSSKTKAEKNKSSQYINRRPPKQYIKLFSDASFHLKSIQRLSYHTIFFDIFRRYSVEGENIYVFKKK